MSVAKRVSEEFGCRLGTEVRFTPPAMLMGHSKICMHIPKNTTLKDHTQTLENNLSSARIWSVNSIRYTQKS